MNAYIYQAALLCEDCARVVITERNMERRQLRKHDPAYYPQGPYADGGGEADTPQHCDDCSVFLENPLTDEGYEYVRDKVFDWVVLPAGITQRAQSGSIEEWASFYEVPVPEPDSAYFDRFDVCEAYYMFATLYHGGQFSEEYAIFGRLATIEYSPGASARSSHWWELEENARNILARKVRTQRARQSQKVRQTI